MTTKELGIIGEISVCSALIKAGATVYIPFGDNSKSDIVAEINRELYRIQIKTCTKTHNGTSSFSVCSSTTHRKNGVKHVYIDSEIDFFALYNLELDETYLVEVNECSEKEFKIRHAPARNNQLKNTHYAEEYKLEKQISSLTNPE